MLGFANCKSMQVPFTIMIIMDQFNNAPSHENMCMILIDR